MNTAKKSENNEPIMHEFLTSFIFHEKVGLFDLGSFIQPFLGDQKVLDQADLVLLGIKDSRGSNQEAYSETSVNLIREQLYTLKKGNWNFHIVDLGDIFPGNTLSDTYFAVTQVLSYLIQHNKTTIIIGGGHELTYFHYRAFDRLKKGINIALIDRQFDLNIESEAFNANTFVNALVTNEPHNLYNLYTIGHQQYYLSQEELDLKLKLNFDHLKLGDILDDIEEVEPFLRNSDLVSIDMSALRFADAPANNNVSPNGLSGNNLCRIARYAGLSNKISGLGIYEYNPALDIRNQTAKLIAQSIWYFMEGYSLRSEDKPFSSKDDYLRYVVPLDNHEFCFLQNIYTQRWWMEVKNEGTDSLYSRQYIPCSYNDYLLTTQGEIPDRWWKTFKKIL